MSEIKWIKVFIDMFDNEKIKLIDAMPERDTIHYIWMRLLVQAGKSNADGFICLSDRIPYTDDMLSTLFNRPINSIRLALTVFKKFKMIDIQDDNKIKIINWEKYQNVEGMERIREQTRQRVAKCRKRKKESEDIVTKSNVTVTQQNKKEEEDKEEDIEREESNDEQAGFRLLCYFEEITGQIGCLSIGALNIAAKEHGEKYVKMAIDRALQTNIFSMKYINGILKNWRREGYPSKEVIEVGSKSNGDGSKFKNIKPEKTRELTDEERECIKELI
ncbi:MAG: DnaD domain protein [Clostridium sp.]|nr:DnaD domain protein [Clostridium sp.]